MTGHELLELAERAARGEAPLRLVTTGGKQPLAGYRAELLCVGAHGAVFLYSRAQAARIAKRLRLELANEPGLDDDDVHAEV